MDSSTRLLVPAVVALSTTYAATLLLERLAASLGLIDRPDARKGHDLPTPAVGGLAMLVGLCAAVLLVPEVLPNPWVLSVAFAFSVLGAIDDRAPRPARERLIVQLGLAVISSAAGGLVIQELGSIGPNGPVVLAGLAIPFTVFAVLGMVNATNMLDGIDGLLGSISLVQFAAFAACAAWLGDERLTTLSTIAMAVLAAFLFFNLRHPLRTRARVFMGDAGSMLIGFGAVWTATELTQRPGGLSPVCALWICALPILDCTAVVVARVRAGRSPMSAGRDHIHHVLAAAGLKVPLIVLLETMASVAAASFGLLGWLRDWPEPSMALAFVALAAAVLLWHGSALRHAAPNDSAEAPTNGQEPLPRQG